MLLPVVLYGNPLLRKMSEDIDLNYPNLDKLLEDMSQTMDTADGVGLAAPQIGLNIRLFIIDASAFAEQDSECEGYRRFFLNAHIIERWGDKKTRNEGCLSIPGIHEDVTRYDNIRMKYMNEKGEEKEEEFSGIKAWIIQHEYDHLDGVMFVDHLSALRKRLLKSKLASIAAGKARVSYRTK